MSQSSPISKDKAVAPQTCAALDLLETGLTF